MTNREIKFAARKAAAEETAMWLRAECDKARNNGMKDVLVSCRDLYEVLSYVEAVKHRDQIEFAGKPLGYCRPEDMRLLLSATVSGISVRARKGVNFNTQIYFLELPRVEGPQIPAGTRLAQVCD